jgi:hypothetical protein
MLISCGILVFERHQLVDVGAAVDDALVVHLHARRAHGDVFQAGDVRDRRRRFRCGSVGQGFIPIQHNYSPIILGLLLARVAGRVVD